jgi:acid stress-induced BolA-like protein IbaG/YrbA
VTSDELETDLNALPDVREVNVVGGGTLIATVVSGSFAGQSEAARQDLVWNLLRSRHEWAQLSNVEFIFTNAPGEAEA